LVDDLCLSVNARTGQMEVVADGLVVDLEVVRAGRDGSDRVAVRVRQGDREVGPHGSDQTRLADSSRGSGQHEQECRSPE
jgi:hypothetical protein